MASTSVSTIQKSFKYDVFLSFRGEDTRKNFVDHLYSALTQKGIETYKDDEKIKQGKMISDELIKAIEDSKFYIIVFSKNYASSSWCLEELVKIIECQTMDEHTAYPVFYDVEPTEVRKQIGAVGVAFEKHKEEKAARKWRKALKEASDLAGFELKSIANGHEAKFIQKIVEEISIELRFINSSSDGNLIGMETRVNEVISSLELGVGDVRMLGIWGMGGAGKTTLARAIFDQISIQFEGESFIENAREVSKASLEGLKKLQKQVLSDVLKDQNIEVSSVSGGKSMMQRRMRGRKVLVVLDDVDHKNQLEALAGDCNWFKPGSRIIVTTRDKQVLAAHGVRLIHNVTLLSQAEAGCLFSRHAFGRENPIQGYEELSRKVLQYADGLPLTIKVMGSHLRDLDESEWKNAIKRLETIPLKDTMEVLELSFDGLENDYKEIFLDVACILKGWGKEDAIRVLESRGFHAEIGLRVLEKKSLITIDKRLGMHDHLEEMGRNIVRRLHPDEPNKQSRLWIDEEIEDILANDLGTQATKCLYLRSPGFSTEIAIKGLAKMKDLRFIHIDLVEFYFLNSVQLWEFDKVSEYLPSSLRFMRWSGFPSSSLPNTFQGKNLVELDIRCSNIVQLWKYGEEKVLNNLRFLRIGFSKLRTFDLRLAPNLKQLTIDYCKNFRELHIPADHHSKLEHLDITASKLTNFHLGNTPNLKILILRGCHDLVEFQMPAESLMLEHLDLTDSKLTNLHLRNTPNLKILILHGCHDLVEFQMPAESLQLEHLYLTASKLTNLHLGNTPNLKTLNLQCCHDLVEFQMPTESLMLEHLDLSHLKLTNPHLGITPNLEKLRLTDCDLVEFQMPAESLKLEYLDLTDSKLTNLHLGSTPNLEKLILRGCHLVEFQMAAESLKLELLDLTDSKLTNLHLGNTPNLKILILQGSHDLVDFQMSAESLKLEHLDLTDSKLTNLHLGNTPNLKKLNLSHSKLKTLHLESTMNLKMLILKGCNDLVEFQMCAESLNLEYFKLGHTKLKTLHLGSTPNLKKLILKGCNDLVEFQMPAESLNLKYLKLSHSKLKTLHLESTPNLEVLILKGCNDLVELEMPSECLKLEELYLGHSKLRTLDLGLTPNLRSLNLENCYDLVEINAPVGYLKKLAFLQLRCCGRFKSFVFNNCSQEMFAETELHLIAETADVCPLHSDNDYPKFRFECYYKEDSVLSLGNLERLISIGLCACTNLERFSRSICGLQFLTKLTLEGSIPEVPRDLDQLECLKKLSFSSAEIKYLPDSICNLKHLKSFKIESCWLLEKLPEDIGRLESLKKLILTDCKLLQGIPNSICKMKCIKKLRLRGCIRVVELPEEIGCLEGLQELNIGGTGIIRLPQSIFQLRGRLRIFGSMRLIDTYGLLLKRLRTLMMMK